MLLPPNKTKRQEKTQKIAKNEEISKTETSKPVSTRGVNMLRIIGEYPQNVCKKERDWHYLNDAKISAVFCTPICAVFRHIRIFRFSEAVLFFFAFALFSADLFDNLFHSTVIAFLPP